jgi:hypothetical protein
VDHESGDFIFIAPGVPHEVFNLSDTDPVVAVVARSSADEWDNIVPYQGKKVAGRRQAIMRALVVGLVTLLALAETPAYRAAIEKYRQDRVAELTAPNGWLAVQGLFWLHEGANAAGSDPSVEIRLPARAPKRLGVFTLNDRTVSFTADPAASVTAAETPVRPSVRSQGRRAIRDPASGTLFVIRRADRVGLRMLDRTAGRKTFSGEMLH